MRRVVLITSAVILLSMTGCRSGIDLSTSNGQMRFGIQAAKMNLWREAQFRFLRAVELNPNDPMVYNNLAVAYEGIGEYENAREAYLRALQIDRSNQYIQRNYSRFVEFYSKRQADEKEAAEVAAEQAVAAEEVGEDLAGDEPVVEEPGAPPAVEEPPVEEEAVEEPVVEDPTAEADEVASDPENDSSSSDDDEEEIR